MRGKTNGHLCGQSAIVFGRQIPKDPPAATSPYFPASLGTSDEPVTRLQMTMISRPAKVPPTVNPASNIHDVLPLQIWRPAYIRKEPRIPRRPHSTVRLLRAWTTA